MAASVEELPGSACVGLDCVGGMDINQLPSDGGVGGATAKDPVNIVVARWVGAEEGIGEEGGGLRSSGCRGEVESVVGFKQLISPGGTDIGSKDRGWVISFSIKCQFLEGDGVGGGSLEGDVGGGSNVEIVALMISQKVGEAEVRCYQNYVDSVD